MCEMHKSRYDKKIRKFIIDFFKICFLRNRSKDRSYVYIYIPNYILKLFMMLMIQKNCG